MEDEQYLYVVTEYASGGEIFGKSFTNLILLRIIPVDVLDVRTSTSYNTYCSCTCTNVARYCCTISQPSSLCLWSGRLSKGDDPALCEFVCGNLIPPTPYVHVRFSAPEHPMMSNSSKRLKVSPI